MRWRYRSSQFLSRLFARRGSVDGAVARAILSDAEYELFARMSVGDQLHSLDVLRTLNRAEEAPPELGRAALLHDVGKVGAGITLVHRAVIVSLEYLDCRWLRRLAASDHASWRYPFYAHLHHAELGAERCREAGSPPRVVALVRHHESTGDESGPELKRWLAALVAADDVC